MKKLDTVTLIGVDCVDIDRLIQAAEICTKDFEFGEVKLLTSLPSTNKHVVNIDPITSTEQYSEFIIRDLDQFIETPHALIIQYDGFILNPNAWDDEFLQYDYIGAPWFVKEWLVERFNFPKSLLGTGVVGNGGFSLRSKKFITLCSQLAQENYFTEFHPEDIVLCVQNRAKLEAEGMQFAPIELAKRFSYEAIDEVNKKWTDQFGFHGLRWTDISSWLKKHPEYTIDNTLSH